MRKKIITTTPKTDSGPDGDWLDLENIAMVEITSEDPDHPIEHALTPGHSTGWQAAQSGEQTIRLLFDAPRQIRRIWLHFQETHVERTHQFVLRWSPDKGKTFKEIVRQQWNFSPRGMQEETENIFLDLPGVTILELVITPDMNGGPARASLAQFFLGQ